VAPAETIGQRLKRLRSERGLNQSEIAGPGVGSAYVSRIEDGERTPSLAALRQLATKLGVTLEQLETGREIPLALEREYQLASAELALALGGEHAAAERTLRRLAGADARDPIYARAHAALGLHAAQRGEHEQAIEQLEAATMGGIRPRERPDLYETLASCYLATGAGARAVALLERCVAVTASDSLLQIRYRSHLGLALDTSGDAQRARALLVEGAELAEGHALPRTRVLHHRALAHAAWTERTPELALAHARRALALLETLDDARQLARAQLTCARLHNLDQHSRQALRSLERAERLCEQTADRRQLGLVRAEQAKALAALGAGEDALRHAGEASMLLADEPSDAALAEHALALAQAAAADIDNADHSFRHATQAYEEQRRWREAAAVAHDWGGALRQARRPEQALDAFGRAALFAARHWSGNRASSASQ